MKIKILKDIAYYVMSASKRALITFAAILLLGYYVRTCHAQELSWREGWDVSVSGGLFASADRAFPLTELNADKLGHTAQIGVSKWLTSTFALTMDAQYRYRRATFTPMLTTDIVNLLRGTQYRTYDYQLLLDMGIGWGHYFAPDDNPTDHNYHTYVFRLSLVPHISDRVSLLLSLDTSARNYAEHIDIAKDRTDLSFRIGLMYHFGVYNRAYCPRK